MEIIDLKDPLDQLEVSKSSTEYLFKDLLKEMKGLKYEITVKFCNANTKEIMETKSLLLFTLILQLKQQLTLINNLGKTFQ